MADIKWSAFPNDGQLVAGDILVGLRGGVNAQFTANPNTITWQATSSTSFTAAGNNGYILGGATTAITLPTTAPAGQMIGIAGFQGTWTVTVGAAGVITAFGHTYSSLSSANNTDTLVLISQSPNNWGIISIASTGLTFT
jgi:hypothetical protein